ncbi:ankyrin repeat domain-containing protein [Aquimarina sp. 2201CG5-10]|uniref:ankyrin repeat domain-containing protein n=1 Tax=Aquimarina callyspongiae TaxID=3098150 RepID=UPI002AB3D1C6|nr:ankyrin repeat domain-containing protein [Aquimarina sp. 2201CG5-10]MDY8135949.1 ankyrin repeat domain-containing protein [Aquimarina sp. 2201CG5-10]
MRYKIIVIVFLISSVLNSQTIHRSICQGDINKLESFLQTGNVNTVNAKGSSLLLIAIYCRQNDAFDLLIKKEIDVNISNQYGETPIQYAARYGDVKKVKALLNKGANVNVIDTDKRTPILEAVQSNNKEIFDLLISSGADINVGISPLHKAVLNDNLDFVKKLIDDKTDPDVLNKKGNTPLEIAIRQRSVEIAEALISKGANLKKVKKYEFKGKYVGQKVPGLISEIFANNFISTEIFVHSPAYSPDGKEIYYTAESKKYHGGTIMVSKIKNGKWTTPKPSTIPGNYREIDPFITSDGSTIYYCSNRPVKSRDSIQDNADLWMVKREGNTWGNPIHLGENVNTEYDDWFPSISKKGTLFFSTGPGRSSNIVYSEYKNGSYQKAIAFGEAINTEYRDYDPFIAPDESFIIFSSNRPDGFGSVDLYISFKKEDGSWAKAKNMGESVNSSTGEFAPKLSHDGKYFYFNRGGDIFWVDAKIISNLK